MVNNTEPLKALGFDATSGELLKATVSFLVTVMIVTTSILAPLGSSDNELNQGDNRSDGGHAWWVMNAQVGPRAFRK